MWGKKKKKKKKKKQMIKYILLNSMLNFLQHCYNYFSNLKQKKFILDKYKIFISNTKIIKDITAEI